MLFRSGTWEVGDLECRTITAAQAAKVRRGDVSWPVKISGPTQAEGDRRAKQVLLRLTPTTTRALDAIAERRGTTRSGAVSLLVAEAT